jgi:hypothetical protein
MFSDFLPQVNTAIYIFENQTIAIGFVIEIYS